jgi:hypothetical protein
MSGRANIAAEKFLSKTVIYSKLLNGFNLLLKRDRDNPRRIIY